MFQKLERSSGNVIGFKATGKLKDEDYQQVLMPEIRDCIRENKTIRLLWQMENFGGWDMKAAWDDLEFGMEINPDVEYIAIVGEKEWEEWMAKIIKPFAKGEIRYFRNEDIEDAWYWLRTAGGDTQRAA